MLELFKRYKVILVITLIILANSCVLLYEKHIKAEDDMVFLSEDTTAFIEQEQEKDKEKEPIILESPVYICGEVKNPGVYWMKEDTIIKDIVDKAHGFTIEADQVAVNLAEPIKAHGKIYIPKVGEKIDKNMDSYDNSNSEQNHLININEADLITLQLLPGVGEVKAKQITDYRATQGLFKTKEELKEVSGIGEKIYLSIEQLITTE